MDKMTADAGVAGKLATKLDRVLDKIDALKRKALESLPIRGLEFDGEQFCDRLPTGLVPWDEINTARRIEIALQIAALKAGALKFLVLDDAEHLDAEGMEALKSAAKAMGFQVVAARVEEPMEPGDGTLAVRKVG
jgi:hypothetical protein